MWYDFKPYSRKSPNHVDANSTGHHVEIINEKTRHQKLLHFVHDEIKLS